MTTPLRGDVDPRPPSGDFLRRYNARVLDPATAFRRNNESGPSFRSTIYIADELLIPAVVDNDVLVRIQAAAHQLGLAAVPEERTGQSPAVVVKLTPTTATVVDAWAVLQTARAAPDLDGADATGDAAVESPMADPLQRAQLHHLVFAAGYVEGQPLESPNSPDETDSLYSWTNAIGRRPVAFVASDPPRSQLADADRPVVYVLDSGCGRHPWLPNNIVDRNPVDDLGDLIGLPDGGDEDVADQLGPLDGRMDRAKGHGTMMCGLIRQRCPDALIKSVRLMDSEGVMREIDLINAYHRIAELARAGRRVDVVSCSFGYFFEDVKLCDALAIANAVRDLGKRGVLVVASAGNHATSRPYYPAALTPFPGGPVVDPATSAPVVSVGALNPDESIAIFSDEGPWVTAWAPGVCVLSTFPKIDGGSGASGPASNGGRSRQTPDPDNFKSGFAIWSGTSMSAPYVGGSLAQTLLERRCPGNAVARAWDAIRNTPGITLNSVHP